MKARLLDPSSSSSTIVFLPLQKPSHSLPWTSFQAKPTFTYRFIFFYINTLQLLNSLVWTNARYPPRTPILLFLCSPYSWITYQRTRPPIAHETARIHLRIYLVALFELLQLSQMFSASLSTWRYGWIIIQRILLILNILRPCRPYSNT